MKLFKFLNKKLEIKKRAYYNEVYSLSPQKCPSDIISEASDSSKHEVVVCINKDYIASINDCMDMTMGKLLDAGILSIHDRKFIEFYSDKVQLVTAVLLHTDNKIFLLKTKRPSPIYIYPIHTLIQGHMNLYNECCTLRENIMHNALKELNEEIETNPGVNLYPQKEIDIVMVNTTASNRGHLGLIIEIKTDAKKYEVLSGEPDKHDVICIDKESLYKYYFDLCPWVLHCLSRYTFFKL